MSDSNKRKNGNDGSRNTGEESKSGSESGTETGTETGTESGVLSSGTDSSYTAAATDSGYEDEPGREYFERGFFQQNELLYGERDTKMIALVMLESRFEARAAGILSDNDDVDEMDLDQYGILLSDMIERRPKRGRSSSTRQRSDKRRRTNAGEKGEYGENLEYEEEDEEESFITSFEDRNLSEEANDMTAGSEELPINLHGNLIADAIEDSAASLGRSMENPIDLSITEEERIMDNVVRDSLL